MERPDLIGQAFRVTRVVNQRKLEFVQSRGSTMHFVYEAYELKSKAGTFVVRRDYVPGTPSVQPTSRAKADPTVDWRPRKGAVRVAGDHVLAGPLSDLVLTRAHKRACASPIAR